MYSNLAYGSQALQYFAYTGGGYEDYHHAPIHHGKRSEVYDRVKLVNHEIKNLSGVFYGSKVIKVWHSGEYTPSPWVTARFQEENNPAIPPVKLLQTGKGGAVISLLENEDNRFLVIVNRDYQNPMQMTIVTDESVRKVLKDGSVVSASLYTNTTEIDPGDVAVYTWKNK
jgi:hypothetical protein